MIARLRDAVSFRHRFGLILPATNTSMEHDLWRIIFRNQGPGALRGVGLHATPVRTPSARLETNDDRLHYGEQFLDALPGAVELAMLAEPHSLILGMSLEHVIEGLEAVREPVRRIRERSGLACAAWPEAISAALTALGARRIGILSPFDAFGAASAARMFEELGFEVGANVWLHCADARQIARVPEWEKERAIVEDLAPGANGLDAVVQCGTNMSVADVTERLEPVLGIPILGINVVTFWHALQQQGLSGPLDGGGRLLRECWQPEVGAARVW
jgi:maleate isomerase